TADRNGRLGDLGVVRFRRLVALSLSGKAIHFTQPTSQIDRTTATATERKLRPVGSRAGQATAAYWTDYSYHLLLRPLIWPVFHLIRCRWRIWPEKMYRRRRW